jgi:hypothetical protein
MYKDVCTATNNNGCAAGPSTNSTTKSTTAKSPRPDEATNTEEPPTPENYDDIAAQEGLEALAGWIDTITQRVKVVIKKYVDITG